MKLGVILVAGGVGSRMKALTPKQFLTLGNKPIVHHSFDLFKNLTEVKELVVVCETQYCHLFKVNDDSKLSLKFALPGKRRQDSVFNGFQALSSEIDLVCIHDSARPFITKSMVLKTIAAADETGAATAAMPVKFTVKESDSKGFVKRTIPRDHLWEIQTPQVIKRSLLQAGFDLAQRENITVTDDVSLVELLGHNVKLVEGSYLNLKITTPDDLISAHAFAEEKANITT